LGYLANRYYFSGAKYKSKKRLDNKVAIITGANTGIGYQTTLDFAKRGAHVIMACKEMKDAEKAVAEIIKVSKNDRVEVEYIDLADLDEVRAFSKKFHSRFDRLDILVNNAGVMVCPNWRTTQGFEMQFGVNHLG
jgi:NAD(P)-dependent dehydrogenase (short-subunit alcohol dehydrogenase family)